ncbi:ionotropic receptor 75a isoform X1 [Drosophila bipectinata]|uniref:ionotropic receptor 75a isoform X1 n=2 Tax=Drosophila bipectinata TaxID=42026 RepID=UPI0038B2F6AC
MVQFRFNFDSRKMSKPNQINNSLDKRDNKYDYIRAGPEKCKLQSAMYFWILLLLASSCVGLPTELDLDYGVAEPLRTALLQNSLMVQFAQHHKRIPRLTYFTCRKPHSSGSELRGVFAAKNAQLIKSLYQSELFVRIVQLDVLAPNPAAGTGGGATRGRGPSGGFSQTPSQAQSNAEWLDGVLRMEALRQIAVVDLACGSLSRRFLELASTKMLYSEKFHWLLIEDLAWQGGRSSSSSGQVHKNGSQAEGEESPPGQQLQATGNEELPTIESFMRGMNLYMNTELTLAKRMSEAAHYTLFDVWNPGLNYGGHVNLTEIGSFTPSGGIQLHAWFRGTSTVRRRMDMQHARVRCMVVVTNKNMTGTLMYYLTHTVSGHIDTMNRFNFNLLMAVRDMFNWTFVLSRTTSWGYVKNGRFDGMIGALIRNETDIGGAPIFYWLERHKWIDVAGRSWSSRPCFIFRHPRSTQKDRIVFLQPFTNDVWVLIVGCGVLTVFILWLLTTIEWKLVPHDGAALIKPKGGAPPRHHYQQKSHHELAQNQEPLNATLDATLRPITAVSVAVNEEKLPEGETQPIDAETLWQRCYQKLNKYLKERKAKQKKSPERVGLFLESVLFFVGIICQQGLGFSTSFVSGRCIVITSLLFSFCIYQFYSASIVGTLLMEKPKTIKTLSDLVHSSLKVGMEDILYNRDYFLHTKDPVSMELYSKKITSVPTTKENEADEDEPVNAAATPADAAKSYRDIVHSHETGAHAKDSSVSNWLDPETGLRRVKHERFAFHVDVAAAYKIIAETFSEQDICDLTEVSMFPPQKTVSIMQKNSPMRKVISYGLRRVTETGILTYHFNVWHSRKPPCVKKIETSDLHVDMDTVSSALLILLFSYGITFMILGIEILYCKWQGRIIINFK